MAGDLRVACFPTPTSMSGLSNMFFRSAGDMLCEFSSELCHFASSSSLLTRAGERNVSRVRKRASRRDVGDEGGKTIAGGVHGGLLLLLL